MIEFTAHPTQEKLDKNSLSGLCMDREIELDPAPMESSVDNREFIHFNRGLLTFKGVSITIPWKNNASTANGRDILDICPREAAYAFTLIYLERLAFRVEQLVVNRNTNYTHPCQVLLINEYLCKEWLPKVDKALLKDMKKVAKHIPVGRLPAARKFVDWANELVSQIRMDIINNDMVKAYQIID